MHPPKHRLKHAQQSLQELRRPTADELDPGVAGGSGSEKGGHVRPAPSQLLHFNLVEVGKTWVEKDPIERSNAENPCSTCRIFFSMKDKIWVKTHSVVQWVTNPPPNWAPSHLPCARIAPCPSTVVRAPNLAAITTITLWCHIKLGCWAKHLLAMSRNSPDLTFPLCHLCPTRVQAHISRLPSLGPYPELEHLSNKRSAHLPLRR